MIKMKLTKGKSPVLVWTDEVESAALDQLKNVANLPIIHGHVAVMPDVLRHVRGANLAQRLATAGIIAPVA
jgi:tRNA-splicing ligase RtcB